MKKIPSKVWWIVLALLLTAEGYAYLRSHQNTRLWRSVPVLEFRTPAPSSASNLEFREQPQRLVDVEGELTFSGGVCGFLLPDGPASTEFLEVFFLEYEAGNPRMIADVFGHMPEVCMRATGAVLTGMFPNRTLTVDDNALSVRVLEFADPRLGRKMWVFRATWFPEGSRFDAPEGVSDLRKRRVASAIRGEVNPPARVLLVGAHHYPSLEEAWLAFEHHMEESLYFEEQAKS